MATRLYGTSKGEQYPTGITEGVGSAVAADGVELTVDLAANLSKQDVVHALERIKAHIFKSNWPPA